jgi:aspartate/methionine/tyrosine aminotransferase
LFFNEFIPLEFNIDEIFKLNKGDSFFVSDWNKTEETIDFPNKLLFPIKNRLECNKNNYYFSDEFQKIKYYFANNILKIFNEKIDVDKFCITNNGTSGLFLVFLALKNNKYENILVFNPSYFTYIDVFKYLGIKYNFLNIDLFGTSIYIDFDRLENYLIKEKIDIIVITDPLFGIGVSIEESNYENIVSICKKHNIWLVIDYLYGGMEWYRDNHIINGCFLKSFNKFDKMILVESISKRLFLNGIKNSLIFANNEIIQEIERLSVSFIGSLSCVQIDLFHELYSQENIRVINKIIHKNIINIKQSHEQLKAMLLGSKYYLSNSNSGYFSLMGIPYYKLKNIKGIEAAKYIANKVNIITIPHDRYGCFSEEFYTFRVNLTLKKEDLYLNISKLLNIYSNDF